MFSRYQSNIMTGYSRHCNICGGGPYRSGAGYASHRRSHHLDGPSQVPLTLPNVLPPAVHNVLPPPGCGSTEHQEHGNVNDPHLMEPIPPVTSDEPPRPSIPFDSNKAFLHWARTSNNGSSLSNNVVDVLFKELLFNPQFNLQGLSYRSAAGMEKYEQSLFSESDGWKECSVRGHVLRYKDSLEAVKLLFSCKEMNEGFMLGPANRGEPYSTPATGTWWRKMQVSTLNYVSPGSTFACLNYDSIVLCVFLKLLLCVFLHQWFLNSFLFTFLLLYNITQFLILKRSLNHYFILFLNFYF